MYHINLDLLAQGSIYQVSSHKFTLYSPPSLSLLNSLEESNYAQFIFKMCARVWMCFLPNSCQRLNCQVIVLRGRASRRWSLTFREGITTFGAGLEGESSSFFSPPPSTSSTMGEHREGPLYEASTSLMPNLQGHWFWNFQTPDFKNKFLLFINYLV